MKVTVKLFATLREGRGKIMEFDFPEQSLLALVIEHLKIDSKDIAILLVNGHDAKPAQELQERDLVAIFPPVGGG